MDMNDHDPSERKQQHEYRRHQRPSVLRPYERTSRREVVVLVNTASSLGIGNFSPCAKGYLGDDHMALAFCYERDECCKGMPMSVEIVGCPES